MLHLLLKNLTVRRSYYTKLLSTKIQRSGATFSLRTSHLRQLKKIWELCSNNSVRLSQFEYLVNKNRNLHMHLFASKLLMLQAKLKMHNFRSTNVLSTSIIMKWKLSGISLMKLLKINKIGNVTKLRTSIKISTTPIQINLQVSLDFWCNRSQDKMED